MKKKLLPILLVLALVVALFAACGSSETPAANTGNSNTPASNDNTGKTDTTTPAQTDDGEDEEEEEEEEEDLAEINVALMALIPVDKNNAQAVVDKLNEMTERDINVKANIVWYDAANYGTQIPMQIQANEQLDLIMFTPVPGASYASYRSANQLMDISELLQKYGQTVLATDGDLIKGTSYGSAIYGVTHYASKAGFLAIQVRKDLAEQAGVAEDLQKATTLTEVEEAFKKITEVTGMPALINSDAEGTVLYPRPFNVGGENFSDVYWYDNAGDGNNLFMINAETDKVECTFLNEDYDTMCEIVNRWYNEGLVYRDAAIGTEYGDSLIKGNVGYAHVRAAELGTKENAEANTGYEMIQIEVAPSYIGTGSCTKFGYCVPVTTKEPAAAVKWLNYLYESKDAINTLTWGVEGRDWVVGADGLATFPEGVDQGSVLYHTMDFLYGNQMMITPWEGSDPDLREQQQKVMDTATVSKYMGFTLDNTGLENALTACSTVRKQYAPALDSGSSTDWQADLATFRAALKDAGIDDLIAAYQAQLDAWLADNG